MHFVDQQKRNPPRQLPFLAAQSLPGHNRDTSALMFLARSGINVPVDTRQRGDLAFPPDFGLYQLLYARVPERFTIGSEH